ncbi:hypothetical protein [Proteiniphilum sp.]|uniref:hypothetical protein n=1 Tax=Proteiniphilum sp. TaxID=1926877 RepID=UPI00331CBA06
MKKDVEILIRDHIVHVKFGNEFATMIRQPDSNGLRKINFSIPLRGAYADVIEGSGIASVDNINYEECSITFRSLPFYETHLIAELITDILKKHETSNS